jgi:hypothetical protein
LPFFTFCGAKRKNEQAQRLRTATFDGSSIHPSAFASRFLAIFLRLLRLGKMDSHGDKTDQQNKRLHAPMFIAVPDKLSRTSVGVPVTLWTAPALLSRTTERAKRLPRIGYLAAGSREVASARIEAFRQGLRELGYIEGQDILIEYRNAAGKPEQVPPNVAELVPGGYALAG